MDETVWLACVDPNLMLDYLFAHRVTPRKLRLLACGCCRRYWSSLTDQRTQQAVHACERFADRRINRAALSEYAQGAQLAVYDAPQFEASAYNAVLQTAGDNIRETIRPALAALQQMARWEAAYECVPGMDEPAVVNEAMRLEQSGQCEVIRELWGNPFRYIAVDEGWLRWSDGTVVKLAQAIYDDRNWSDLPVLADALMDAGCADSRLLGHLQTTQGHLLGCWALDVILGRE
jgi:hypothetical protein